MKIYWRCWLHSMNELTNERMNGLKSIGKVLTVLRQTVRFKGDAFQEENLGIAVVVRYLLKAVKNMKMKMIIFTLKSYTWGVILISINRGEASG